jgi:hypothetical protein
VGISYTVGCLLASQEIIFSPKVVQVKVFPVPKHYNIKSYGGVKVKYT